MIISLLTLFLFAGTLCLVYFNMKYFEDENMWPADKTNFFMKRGDESFTPTPRKAKEPLPLPSANDKPGEYGESELLPGVDDEPADASAPEEPVATP